MSCLLTRVTTEFTYVRVRGTADELLDDHDDTTNTTPEYWKNVVPVVAVVNVIKPSAASTHQGTA
jgi:hypothetical protein